MKYIFWFIMIFSFHAQANEFTQLLTPMLRFCLEDENDLEDTYERLTGQVLPVSVFDEIGRGKVEIIFFNDFDFKDPNGPDPAAVSDDVGRTHGMKLSIYKDISSRRSDQRYFINVSYETNLYTNSKEPDIFDHNYRDTLYWDNDRGVYISDVYFKEENVFKVLIGKVRSHNAFFWEVGGGFQEINTDDIDRGVILSALGQQKWFHRSVNEAYEDEHVFREYNYLKQEESERQFYLEMRAGKDQTLLENGGNRVFVRYGVFGRASGVKNASHIGGFVNLGYDHEKRGRSFIPSMRFQTGIEQLFYKDDNYAEYFFEIGTTGDNFGTTVKYTVPLSNDPNYLNPLPIDFTNRTQLAPRQEPTIWIMIDGRLP